MNTTDGVRKIVTEYVQKQLNPGESVKCDSCGSSSMCIYYSTIKNTKLNQSNHTISLSTLTPLNKLTIETVIKEMLMYLRKTARSE